MSIMDIGSNIGYYVLLQRNIIGSDAKIIAIEPIPQNIEFLKKNLELNNDLKTKVIQGAVSNKNDYSYIYSSTFFNLGTFHPSGKSKEFIENKLKVKTFSLSNLCLKHGIPDLIRMDVEGHEAEVLNGLIPNIGVNNLYPSIIFET